MSAEGDNQRSLRRFERWTRPLRILSHQRGENLTHGAEPVATSQPVHAMFQDAQNTRIQNATFNIYAVAATDGGQTAPTDSRHESSSTDTPSPGSILQTPSPISTPATSHIAGSSSSISGDLQAAPSEIYRDRLQRKNLGHPLWIPGPNERLSAAYRECGVMVGDVGVLTSHGSFSHLFSVVHEATHSRNAGIQLPPGFVPFTTSPEMCDIEEFREYDGITGSYLADDCIMRVSGVSDSSTVLQTSARQAAVLMLPETVHTTALLSIKPLRDYIRRNLHNWYKFVLGVKGWDVKNGDIRVVHSCRKSTGYGIATISNGTPDPITELVFSTQEPRSDVSGCKYKWSHKGCATVKAGPSSSLGSSQPANQCLFVGTIDFKLGDEQWTSVEPGDIPYFLSPNDHKNDHPSQSHRQSMGKPDLLGGSSSAGHEDSNYSGSQGLSYNSAQFGANFMQTSLIIRQPLPSDLLVDVLMRAVPSATSVSVCTQDWGPYLVDSIQNDIEFIDSVLSNNNIREEAGMAFFEPKNCGSTTPELLSETAQAMQHRPFIVDTHPTTSERDNSHRPNATSTLHSSSRSIGSSSSLDRSLSRASPTPISQLLHSLGITREDLNKRSDQMRQFQFLTADTTRPLRFSKRDDGHRLKAASTLHSSSEIGSSSSLARSLSRASSASMREGTPPATPVKPEPQDAEMPHRRMDSMEMVPSSPMSSPTRCVNLVSSPGPMGPPPAETEYDDLPYTLPPGPYSPNKPDLSYAAIVGRAILSSPEHRLTLQEIYDWITIVYPHYKHGEMTWMNSIRHVLSTTVCFRKVPRDRSIGRTLWAIFDEDLECFSGGGFKKHLCKDYVNATDSEDKVPVAGKGKAKERKRADEDENADSRKAKKPKKDTLAVANDIPSASRTHSAFIASTPSLTSHPLFPPTHPTRHHQPYYQSIRRLPLPMYPSEVASMTKEEESSDPSPPSGQSMTPFFSVSPFIPSSISSMSSSSVPDLTSDNSSSAPSSLPPASEVDIDMTDNIVHDDSNVSSAAEDMDDDNIFNTFLRPVHTRNTSPKDSGLQPRVQPRLDSDDEESNADRKGKKRQNPKDYFGAAPSSPTLNLHGAENRSDDVGSPLTPISSFKVPSAPPRSTHKISSIRSPISHKGLHISPSARLVHHKSNFDPPPIYAGAATDDDNDNDNTRTPSKRHSHPNNANVLFGVPVTPQKLNFASSSSMDSPSCTPGGLSASPSRAPGSDRIIDPDDSRTLLDKEMSQPYDTSPGGLFGEKSGPLLYDSDRYDTQNRWW